MTILASLVMCIFVAGSYLSAKSDDFIFLIYFLGNELTVALLWMNWEISKRLEILTRC